MLALGGFRGAPFFADIAVQGGTGDVELPADVADRRLGVVVEVRGHRQGGRVAEGFDRRTSTGAATCTAALAFRWGNCTSTRRPVSRRFAAEASIAPYLGSTTRTSWPRKSCHDRRCEAIQKDP